MTSTWRTLPLWSLTTVQREVVEPTDLGDEVVHYSIPSVDSTGTGQIEESESIKSAKFRLSGGEVLISKLNPRKSRVVSVAASSLPIVSSTEFVGLRAGDVLDSRYLAYLLQSDFVRQELDARVQSVTRSHQRVAPEDITHLNVAVAPPAEQRRIADFLDAETATIDSYMKLHERLVSVLHEKTSAAVESLLLHGHVQPSKDGQVPDSAPFPSRFPIGRLKNVAARVDVGIAEAATHAYVSDGVPLIRSTNIRPNSLEFRDMLHIAPWFAERNRSKYVFAGDILTVRTGNAGVSAVIPRDLNRSQTFTQLITTLRDGNSAEYFCQFLNSRVCRQYFDTVSWGSAQKNISVPLLANTPVPIPPIEMQRKISASVDHLSEVTSSLASKAEKARQLASERRQALITAAVTGQFDVSTASGRNVTDGATA
ncbi:restriction endonuclease subunit S [Streptomyces sp. NPDC001999]